YGGDWRVDLRTIGRGLRGLFRGRDRDHEPGDAGGPGDDGHPRNEQAEGAARRSDQWSCDSDFHCDQDDSLATSDGDDGGGGDWRGFGCALRAEGTAVLGESVCDSGGQRDDDLFFHTRLPVAAAKRFERGDFSFPY